MILHTALIHFETKHIGYVCELIMDIVPGYSKKLGRIYVQH
jgi:hypothetical protein